MVNPEQEDFKRLFKIFERLTEQLGLTVDKVESVSIDPVDGWQADHSFLVISKMIKILDDSKIPLQMEFDGYTLETWMISIVIGMSNINLTNLTSPLLDMIEAAFRLNPLIIEPCIKVIIKIMLRYKSNDSYPSYKSMMIAAINGTTKVKRLQKMISLLVLTMRATLMESCDDRLTLHDVLPTEVGEVFSEAVESLPNSQALSTMRALLYHLELDSLSHVQASCIDNLVVLNTEVIVEFLTKLLNGVTFADHSVPDIVKSKFKCQLEDLQNLLRKYGEILEDYQEHNILIDRLFSTYFKLTHTYGAIRLLFDDYDGSPLKPLSHADLKPTNLSYVHQHLTPNQWRKIFKNVMLHDGCPAKHDLMCLIVQKISAVAQIEVGTEGPGSLAARFLLEIANLEWMWSQVVALSPLFQAMELDNFVKNLVKFNKNDQATWKTLIEDNGDKFLENRRLVLATAMHLLLRAGKILAHSSENHSSLTSQVMSHIVVSQMLEYELSQLITEDIELIQVTTKIIDNMSSLISVNLKLKTEDVKPPLKIPHQSYFEILNTLPLHHFSLLNQSIILLSVVALLYDLPISDANDIYLFNIIYNILDGPHKHDSRLLGHLNPGLLLKFLGKRAVNCHYQKDLLNKLCIVALKDYKTAKQLMKCVSQPSKDTLWITTMVIQAIEKTKKFTSNETNEEMEIECLDEDQVEEEEEEEKLPSSEKQLDKKECIKSLIATCLPIILEEKPSLQLLPDYAIILKHTLMKQNLGNLNKLLSKLDEYSQLAITDYTNGGDQLVQVMMGHRLKLGDYFPKFLINLAWIHLLNDTEIEPSDIVSQLVFTSANVEEFNEIITQLLSQTIIEVKRIKEKNPSSGLERVLKLWNYLIHGSLTYDKCKIRTESLISMITPVTELIGCWSQEGICLQSVTHLLEFYSNLMPLLSIELKPVLIDTVLITLSAVPLHNTDREILISRTHLIIDTLFSLYLFRTTPMLDRLPPLLQRYRCCLTTLASVSEPSVDNISSALSAAIKLERFARTMVKRNKNFARVAPYIIADVINIFGKHQIHADIKNVYTNIIFAFISISDSHAVTYLKSVLPLASKEIFKNISNRYNKHYRFVGKI